MVFYIEACESGSMMTNLPDNIDGKLDFTLSENSKTKDNEPEKINKKHWWSP